MQIYEKAYPLNDLDCLFSCVKAITGGQLQGVRGLLGHLLHTVTFRFSLFDQLLMIH